MVWRQHFLSDIIRKTLGLGKQYLIAFRDVDATVQLSLYIEASDQLLQAGISGLRLCRKEQIAGQEECDQMHNECVY